MDTASLARILPNAPDAKFIPAPADGVLPENFLATTNLPTYVKLNGQWLMPLEPRMDGSLVLDREGTLWVKEGRRVQRGEKVAVGSAEDGSEGIYVQPSVLAEEESEVEFRFMSSVVSREKPIDYSLMGRILIDE